jgi:hypothetical protein
MEKGVGSHGRRLAAFKGRPIVSLDPKFQIRSRSIGPRDSRRSPREIQDVLSLCGGLIRVGWLMFNEDSSRRRLVRTTRGTFPTAASSSLTARTVTNRLVGQHSSSASSDDELIHDSLVQRADPRPVGQQCLLIQ